ncbi:MAG: NAD-dependent succinate-semialdehyde dehydrogenase [Gammaproteobacteria bacterium]|nr:NAD-dependent succinate-semialdehyde dehydrogenase [Gammaproteobacteria bacterium]MBU1602399.1 NAD-dependent succinate-semialdehyde dehydrogenase [Gammaproteobacteria bacterium]MBU2433204.1 NAD-dependent succinate-semialdehyde dehydrogenase [Gammaproteobacteria bacterium]MBU2451120.1 NAD-dependent succinate-semialdehyde dehydrogenase [Gammaproteobacteria bacterium]
MNLQNPQLLRSTGKNDQNWNAADDGATFAVINPATGEQIGQVPLCGAAETRRAIDAANAAWPAWRALTARRRAQILQAWNRLILDNADDLAQIITAECGKPLTEAKGEVIYGASFIEWFAEEGKRTYGESIPSPASNTRLIVIKQPIGVCAAITPWNFPFAMITRKVAPALAAGCPVVIKPAEATPLSALALAVLAEQAGFPAGVLNVITGKPADIGGELCANPIVRKLSFTGSTAVGRLLMAQCAPTIKKLSLELGGNAPFIVFDDADVNAAVDGALAAKYRNTGQTCVCANRFLVQSGIYEEFAGKFAEKASRLQVGDGTEAGVAQGPLINAAGLSKVEAHVADALSKGARVLCGGARHERGGNFFQPTVLADVTTAMKVAREETFGPVAPLFKFETEAEAIAMANDTEFGLAAYFFTRDVGRCWRVGEALEYGMVGVNTGLISNEVAPFGGIKQSGLGREGSKYGIEDYLEIKYLCFDING